jgi:hypothetical protein
MVKSRVSLECRVFHPTNDEAVNVGLTEDKKNLGIYIISQRAPYMKIWSYL